MNELFMVWRKYVVAKLIRTNNNVKFIYLRNTYNFKKAIDNGFKGYPAFSDLNKNYDDVFDIFKVRLINKNRDDYEDWLKELGLNNKIILDDFELLGYSQGKLLSDDFYFKVNISD